MKWGILAPGTIANKFAQTVIGMNTPEEQLLAVGSRNLEKAKTFGEQYGIPNCYGSYEELTADKTIDAVYICSPNNYHYEHAMLCLNAGKHVLCEKPFTVTAADAERLYKAAEEKGLFIMEGFWIRFLPLYESILEIIQSGKYGKLMHARCNYGFVAKGARLERKMRADLAGGALLDIGIYNLGFLQMVMGSSPESFQTTVRRNEYGTDTFSTVDLVYPGERTAYAAQCIGMVMDRQAALYFEHAEIDLPDFQQAFSMTVKPEGEDPYEVTMQPEINGFEYEIREVTACVRAGLNASRIYRPEQSVSLIHLLEEIRMAWGMKYPFES